MAALEQVVQQIRQLAGGPAVAQLSDRQLLECYATKQDADAFAELVRRHGPLVLGACRRLLRHDHDADDAFQATFVVLARKAGSVRWQDSVSHWLYEVACRIALKARNNLNLRQRHERQAGAMSPISEASQREISWSDAQAALDEELAKLPAKFRAPLVLCYLEGKSRDEAAQELGWSEGAVKGMLERGRALLRDRLASRGLALSAGLLTLTAAPAVAAVSPALLQATVAAACIGSAALSAPVAALSEGVIRAMFLTKLKIAAAITLAIGVATGAGVVGHQAFAGRDADPVLIAEPEPAFDEIDVLAFVEQAAVVEQEEKKPAKPAEKPDLAGVVKAVADDGKKITIALPPKNKGEAGELVDIKLTDATKISYFGVEKEQPTVGYMAAVTLKAGSKDEAATVRLGLKKAGTGEAKPDVQGKVASVAEDKSSIKVESVSKKDGQVTTHEIKLTDKTKLAYVNVDENGKNPTVGYFVRVALVAGSQDTAANVVFMGSVKPKGDKPENPDPNAKPKPEKPDPNAKPKPENPDPKDTRRPKPKPEKPDPNAKPKPENPDPNAKPKPEKPDPNAKPKPEKPDPNQAPKPEKQSSLTLGIGITKVLQLSTKQPIKEVINEKDTVARVSAISGDPTRVLVTGLAPGLTRVTLIGANGDREVFGPK